MSWSQEKIKKRKKYCDNLPLVGIERCEAHDKKRQDEKDKDESPECVNNTHGQRDGQCACKKMKMAIFYILCLDDPRKRSPWIRLLWFPASASLSLFSDDHTSLISNWDQQEFWYLHEVLTVFAILCSLPIITKKNWKRTCILPIRTKRNLYPVIGSLPEIFSKFKSVCMSATAFRVALVGAVMVLAINVIFAHTTHCNDKPQVYKLIMFFITSQQE